MRISRAGSRNRVPAGGVPAKLQAPGIGCLQACRHPSGTWQAPSRHPGSAAGCLQAPAGSQQAPWIGCRVPAGTVQEPGLHRADKMLSSSHGHCRAAVRKINESLTRGPAEHGPQSCTKRRKDPLLLSCYRRPLCVCASRRRRIAMSEEGESVAEVSTRARVRQASTKLSLHGDCRARVFNADS